MKNTKTHKDSNDCYKLMFGVERARELLDAKLKERQEICTRKVYEYFGPIIFAAIAECKSSIEVKEDSMLEKMDHNLVPYVLREHLGFKVSCENYTDDSARILKWKYVISW